MAIRIYNTLSGQKEEFIPLQPGRVKMYVCGPTVYDSCHIGHARAAVVFDVIVKYLKRRGFQVTYVRNYTDVDDKVINRARDEGVNFLTIADRYIAEYRRDIGSLGVAEPDYSPRVTEHIEAIVRTVGKLINRGHAYESGGDVFFDVTSFTNYGKLSKRDAEQMMAGVRVDINERKKNELDFALWKAAKPGEPSWDSPWGKGRPGWHIECSVMSSHYLGQPFDIHGGGVDLVFPHHENEIAQAEGAEGKPFCKYWIHNGHVSTKGEKISKSLGNFIPIPELINRWRPEAIRIFLLSKHHSSPVDFTDEALDSAVEQLDRFYEAILAVRGASHPASQDGAPKDTPLPESGLMLKELIEKLPSRFDEAMDEDFNTALAYAHMLETLRALNRALPDLNLSAPSHNELAERASSTLIGLGGILGILQERPASYTANKIKKALERSGISEDEIQTLIKKRDLARKEKNWPEADRIRKELLDKGIQLKDGPEGTAWTIK